MQRRLIFALILMLLQPSFSSAAVGIVSSMGVEVLSSAPASVQNGALLSRKPVLFQEVANGVVPQGGSIGVDHDGSPVIAAPTLQPTVGGFVPNPALTPTSLGEGQGFNSYFLHFDPCTSPYYVSVVEFDSPIIGVQLFSEQLGLSGYTGTLEQGDALVGGATAYPTGAPGRGVEEDVFLLAIDGAKILLAGTAFGADFDQIRIFTQALGPMVDPQAVPEFASVATWTFLLLVGACCLGRRCGQAVAG